MANATAPSTGGYSSFEALGDAIGYLIAHVVLAAVVTMIGAGLLWLTSEKKGGKYPSLWSGAPYCGAFALFGMATAYFLSLGLNATTGDTNSLLNSFLTPFISLLTGGVAFAASKTREEIGRNALVVGVACFLLTCIFSYQTFEAQILHGVGRDPGDPNEIVNHAPGNELTPPARDPGPASNSQADQVHAQGGQHPAAPDHLPPPR